MMSNAMWAASLGKAVSSGSGSVVSTRPAGEPALQPLMVGLLAVGCCVLVVWLVRRVARPDKLTLRRTPRRPNSVNPAHVLVLFMVWVVAYRLAAVALAPMYGMQGTRTMVLAALCAQAALLAGGLMVAAVTFRWGLGRGLGLSLRHWLCDAGRGVLGLLAVMPVCYLMLAIGQALVPDDLQPTHDMLLAVGEAKAPWRAIILLSTVLLAPLAEEVFFRGLVQSMLRRYLHSPWAAIGATSVVFALVHVSLWHTMPALVALGVALGYNYERCGRLWPAIVMHSLFNAVNIWAYLAGPA